MGDFFDKTGVGIGGNQIGLDPDGNIILVGTTSIASNGVTTVSKFTPSGQNIWVTPNAGGNALAIDSQGNIYGAGVDVFNNNYVVTKVNSEGQLLWTFNRQGFGPTVTDATVDPFGNLLVASYDLDLNSAVCRIITLKFPKDFTPAPIP